MAERNERLGLLLIFDCIATILATFGVALIFQMLVTHSFNANTMILSCFFVGIKILLLGICDITGIGRHLVVALIFIVIADCIAFAINFLMVFGLSSKLLLATLLADAVIVAVSHLIWSRAFGGKHSEKRERKAWLNERDIEREDEGYEDIFENVSGKKEKQDKVEKPEKTAAAVSAKHDDEDDFADLFGDDDEDDYDDAEPFDYDDEEALPDYEEADIDEEDYDEALDEDFPEALPEVKDEVQDGFDDDDDDVYLDEEAFKSLLINDDDLAKVADAVEEDETPEGSESAPEIQEIEETQTDDTAAEALPESPDDTDGEEAAEAAPVADETEIDEAIQEVSEAPENKDEKAEVRIADEDTKDQMPSLDTLLGTDSAAEAHEESAGDFAQIEERLGALLEEINTTTVETGRLEKSVTAFKDELDHLTPITKDSDIVETGDIIRDKLKNIIDKQFIVDEVLDDLIRLSGQINKRIDDLDAIEADLNRRSEILDKKEFLFMTRKNAAQADVAVKADEVLLENEDAEIIIDEGDLELLKNYLKDHPEL